jgi:hypothetical protein
MPPTLLARFLVPALLILGCDQFRTKRATCDLEGAHYGSAKTTTVTKIVDEHGQSVTSTSWTSVGQLSSGMLWNEVGLPHGPENGMCQVDGVLQERPYGAVYYVTTIWSATTK